MLPWHDGNIGHQSMEQNIKNNAKEANMLYMNLEDMCLAVELLIAGILLWQKPVPTYAISALVASVNSMNTSLMTSNR